MLVLLTRTVLAVSPYSYSELQIKLAETNGYRALRNAKQAPNIPESAYEMASRGTVASGVEDAGEGPK